MALERVLERRERRIIRERLHRLHARAVGLHGEQAAAAHRDAVEPHGAGAADAVLAADMGSGEPEPVSEEVGEEKTRLDVLDDDLAVDGDGDLGHAVRSQARRSARSTSVPVRWLRYAADAWIESAGSTACAASRPASRAAEAVSAVPVTRLLRVGLRGRPVGHRARPHAHVACHTIDATERDGDHREPKVPARSESSSKATPSSGAGMGQHVSTTSSPGASVVR